MSYKTAKQHNEAAFSMGTAEPLAVGVQPRVLPPRDREVIAGAQAILAAVYKEVQERKAGNVPPSCVSTDLYTAAVNLALLLKNAGHEVPRR